LSVEQVFDTVECMDNIDLLASDLERERRSLAMLSPQAVLSREKAIHLIERCQAVVEASRQRRIG
jgi:hypothetical protein